MKENNNTEEKIWAAAHTDIGVCACEKDASVTDPQNDPYTLQTRWPPIYFNEINFKFNMKCVHRETKKKCLKNVLILILKSKYVRIWWFSSIQEDPDFDDNIDPFIYWSIYPLYAIVFYTTMLFHLCFCFLTIALRRVQIICDGVNSFLVEWFKWKQLNETNMTNSTYDRDKIKEEERKRRQYMQEKWEFKPCWFMHLN